ncbi:MAG: hypothetical protein QXW94_07105 [Desulfurococcaceae archaeon]
MKEGSITVLPPMMRLISKEANLLARVLLRRVRGIKDVTRRCVMDCPEPRDSKVLLELSMESL